MNEKIKKELYRKSIHLCSLSIPVLAIVLKDFRIVAGGLLGFALFVSISIEILRFTVPATRNVFNKYLGHILREHEFKFLTGSTYLLLAALSCFVLFPVEIFAAAMAFLVLGDTCAALVGKQWGSIKLSGHKSLQGSLAFFGICLIAASAIPGLPYLVGAVGALTATVFELLPLKLDDNLTIPFSAAIAMQLMVGLP